MNTQVASERPAMRLRAGLALVAMVFGGLVYGPGNALVAHAGHQSEQAQHTGHLHPAAPPWQVPAHCAFCLDGIAPQPTQLIVLGLRVPTPPLVHQRATVLVAATAPRTTRPQSRAPPPA
jgi:hypothetical protein